MTSSGSNSPEDANRNSIFSTGINVSTVTLRLVTDKVSPVISDLIVAIISATPAE